MKKLLLAGVAAGLMLSAAVEFAAPAFAEKAPQSQDKGGPDREIAWADVKAKADGLWDKLDANHDGKLDQADRDARVLEHFAEIDANHDGVVSKDEFLAFHHAREAKWKEKREDMPPPPPPGGKGPEGKGPEGNGPHGMGMMGPHRMHPGMMGPEGFIGEAIIHPAMREARQGDTLTRAAFDAAVKARFDKLDANHDGKLTREERRAAFGPRGPHGWHHEGRRGPPPGDGDGPPPPSGDEM
jgi:hypothetical protein